MSIGDIENLAARRAHAIDPQDPRWRSFVNSTPTTLFQHPDWNDVVCATYGYRAEVWAAFVNDHVVGGIPSALIDDARGKRRVLGAFADVCEPIGKEWPLIEHAITSTGIPWASRSRNRMYPSATEVSDAGIHQWIEVGRSVEAAEGRCHPKQRYAVRAAIRAGVGVRRSTSAEDLRKFYDLHSAIRARKHRLLPQPLRFFERIVDRYFPDRGFLLMAEDGRKTIAAMLFLIHGDTLYYKFSASDVTALQVHPNHLLLWHAVKEAIGMGLGSIDLGISTDESLARFKRRLGAQETHVFRATYRNDAQPSHASDLNSTLATLTGILTDDRVPLEIVQAAGNVLYGYFV